MRIAFITDIYGVNNGVRAITSRLQKIGADVSLVSPYRKEDLQFTSEKQAYTTFLELCGHDNYCSKVLDTIENDSCNILLGSSAGASAAWLACSRQSAKSIDHLLCFYPTRIRKYLQNIPEIPTTVIFPEYEELFPVDTLIDILRKNELVQCVKTPFPHGFLNPSGNSFNHDAFTLFFGKDELLALLNMPKRYRNMLMGIIDMTVKE